MSQKNKEKFREIIDDLISGKIETGLPPQKRWIPKYVYHFTDILNAKNILSTGYIYSRKSANELEYMQVDNASQEVINHTEEKCKAYARFYFRPKTPTQFWNEGIRSAQQINSELNAHCPVPVFFLFDSYSMLTLENSQFTYGNLATKNTALYNDDVSFKEMPFSYVYHEGSFDSSLKSQIIYNRHAELIVPEKTALKYLKMIVCRSNAEKETFINLLDAQEKEYYKSIIVVDTRNAFFNGCFTYVEDANLTSEKIVLTFNQSRGDSVFKAYLQILEESTKKRYTWEKSNYPATPLQEFNLSNLEDPNSYIVEFYLDKHLAYKGVYRKKDSLPF
ncbi:DUF4433 domain-containing protein [Bacillus velezensis]|uniref:DarT ssDNA thymidine ADP-ribosyltransferase family protein n=1 Tax=Bacillus velezensis TaxID=492670 RepID=UPI001F1D0905|nr:DarT ssDNA thymidine ADP-ribosyltransferase family protein [Bacillus velezensis]UGW84555.1 DUF4433 domain-containing protein [Bacillus velezensis]